MRIVTVGFQGNLLESQADSVVISQTIRTAYVLSQSEWKFDHTTNTIIERN